MPGLVDAYGPWVAKSPVERAWSNVADTMMRMRMAEMQRQQRDKELEQRRREHEEGMKLNLYVSGFTDIPEKQRNVGESYRVNPLSGKRESRIGHTVEKPPAFTVGGKKYWSKPTGQQGVVTLDGYDFLVSRDEWGKPKMQLLGKQDKPESYTPLSVIGKLLSDRNQYQPGTPEYAYFNKVLNAETSKVTGQGVDPEKLYNRATGLRKEFIQQSDTFVKVRDSYNRVEASAQDPTAAGDLALVFNYMKILDPGSVVRESEFANAAASGGWGERLQAAARKIIAGERLSDEMRADFLNRARMLFKKQKNSQKKLISEYRSKAGKYKVPRDWVIVDYFTPGGQSGGSERKVKRTGRTPAGRRVVEYEDGTIEYLE